MSTYLLKARGVVFPVSLFQRVNFTATPLIQLETELMSLWVHSMAKGSLRTRHSQWKKFQDFYQLYGLDALPASVHTICLYIAFLARSLEFSTILNCVSSLAPHHHRHNFKSPNLDHFKVKEALAGVKRQRLELPNKRDVIDPQHLLAIHALLHTVNSSFRETFWRHAWPGFSLCFADQTYFTHTASRQHYRVCDVSDKGDKIFLSVSVLKTSRFLCDKIVIPIPKHGNSHALCPAAAILKMLEKSKAIGRDPLFSYLVDGKLHVFDADRFNATLRSYLS